jgi:hypothetical protein
MTDTPAEDAIPRGPAARLTAAWRQRLLVMLTERLFSGLSGMSARDWFALLAANDFAVDVPHLPRALLVSLASLPNSVDRWREDRWFGPAVDGVRVRPPLFVLGHWRTGTTHLHNLLAADPRFAAPNLYQVFNPHTFLTNEGWLSKYVAPLLPERRLMDNVRLGVGAPQEDEFALATATGLSPYLSWAFPRRREQYDRYLTFQGVPVGEVTRWKAALAAFTRKLTWKYGRPLVLKSPPHTARVRLLLEVFPDARFVHLTRDPYTVFRSMRHFERTAAPAMALQHAPPGDPEARVLNRYRTLSDAYLAERGLIPAGRLHELRFEDLVRAPVDRLRELYAALALPDFEVGRPAVEAHLRSVRGYRRNEYAPLDGPTRRRVADAWADDFAAWGYPP